MKAGLYLHIPFCIKKCGYCDFYSVLSQNSTIEQFIKAMVKEMSLYSDHPVFSEVEFGTVYLGGGTPSLLSAGQIAKIVTNAQRHFRFSPNWEFTIEANPETLSLSRLRDYGAIGINRLSLGIQAFSDRALKILGRIHNTEQAKKSVAWASQAGFDNINLDLIFAIPGQTLNEWKENIKQAILLKPQHLSIYCLTIEPGTPLERKIRSGSLQKAHEDIEREMYLWSIDALLGAGYQQYEISNFSMPRFECQHNLNYWNGSPYLGLGPAAHSFWNDHRQWNVASLEKYFNFLNNCIKPIAGQEELSQNQQMLEFIYLHLRTGQGIDVYQFQHRFNRSFIQKFGRVVKCLNEYSGEALFHIEENKFKLTPGGFVLFDEICQYFADEI